MGAVDGLAKALAAEHAAVYAYGVIGARTSGRLRATATAAFDAHRARRDQLRTMIISRGGSPAESLSAYDLPPITGAAEAVRLAVRVEAGITAAYLELVADREASLRKLAALAMQESTTRAYGLQPSIEPFPGMPGDATTPGPTPTPSG